MWVRLRANRVPVVGDNGISAVWDADCLPGLWLIEQAIDEDGGEINVDNLAGMHFQGPPELVPLFGPGDRVQIVTTTSSGMHIASIKPAPLS